MLKVLTILVFALQVQAQPRVHPELHSYFTNPAMENVSKAVILVFKNKLPLNQGSFSPTDRVQTQALLMKNAEASQASVTRTIENLRKQGVDCETKIYWLNNSMAVYATQKVLKQLMQIDDVLAVYPNRAFAINLPFSHPITDHNGDDFTYGLKKLKIPELRLKKSDLDGRGVKVGILDTGIDASHPDLKNKVMTFKDFVIGSQKPYDDHGHGTHVAGTIAGGNASGTSIGVAPGVKLIIAKIFNKGGASSEAKILEAMQWMADPDGNPSTNDAPALVSNSWGGSFPSASMDPADEPECRALDGWVKLGIAPIFAAGNSGSGAKTVNIPAACPAAIAVGATDDKDSIANFSSRGPAVWKTGSIIKPTVSAPGVKVYSSLPGGGYGDMSGTSMATPHTSGLVSLIYQVNPKIDVTSMAKILTDGAFDLGEKGNDNVYGWGRIDALNTLKLLYGN